MLSGWCRLYSALSDISARYAFLGFVLTIVGGAILGLLLAIPVAAIFTWLIYRDARTTSRSKRRDDEPPHLLSCLRPMTTFIHETAIVGCRCANRQRLLYRAVYDGRRKRRARRPRPARLAHRRRWADDRRRRHAYLSVRIDRSRTAGLKYAGEPTATEIGKRNQIREFVTIHRGTSGGGGLTKIGDNNLFMAQAHVAHDCQIGSEVIMANAATLAGHVEIADRANVGAYSGVHQYCRVGVEAFVGGYSVVVKDAPPFAIIQGNHAKCYGLNRVGMKRRGYSKETIEKLHRAYHLLLSAKLNTTQALERIRAEITRLQGSGLLVEFYETTTRGVVK